MNKLIVLILLVGFVISFSGCASYMSYKASEKEIVGQRVMASGNEAAIKAFRLGDTVGVGSFPSDELDSVHSE